MDRIYESGFVARHTSPSLPYGTKTLLSNKRKVSFVEHEVVQLLGRGISSGHSVVQSVDLHRTKTDDSVLESPVTSFGSLKLQFSPREVGCCRREPTTSFVRTSSLRW
jgi:hypothetical protein